MFFFLQLLLTFEDLCCRVCRIFGGKQMECGRIQEFRWRAGAQTRKQFHVILRRFTWRLTCILLTVFDSQMPAALVHRLWFTPTCSLVCSTLRRTKNWWRMSSWNRWCSVCRTFLSLLRSRARSGDTHRSAYDSGKKCHWSVRVAASETFYHFFCFCFCF